MYHPLLCRFPWLFHCTAALKIAHSPECKYYTIIPVCLWLFRSTVAVKFANRLECTDTHSGFCGFSSARCVWKLHMDRNVPLYCYAGFYGFSSARWPWKLHTGRNVSITLFCRFLLLFRCTVAVQRTHPVAIRPPVNDWQFPCKSAHLSLTVYFNNMSWVRQLCQQWVFCRLRSLSLTVQCSYYMWAVLGRLAPVPNKS